jgi:hypothetical protein
MGPLSVWTLRRRLHVADFAWKRPRYVFRPEGTPPRAEKGALTRQLKQRPARAVLLVVDETTLRFLPPLRAAGALRGQQAQVPLSGRNDQRVLFGALNVGNGRRLLLRRARACAADFQAFLRRLRRRHYRAGQPLWLLLDKAPCHVAAGSLALAAELNMRLLWLPRQCSERECDGSPVAPPQSGLGGQPAASYHRGLSRTGGSLGACPERSTGLTQSGLALETLLAQKRAHELLLSYLGGCVRRPFCGILSHGQTE